MFSSSDRIVWTGDALGLFLKSEQFPSNFDAFVLSRSSLHTTRHVLTVRNYCFPVCRTLAKASQV